MSACAMCQHDPDAPVLARWEFVVPLELGSLNERMYNNARGWAYRKKRNDWYTASVVSGSGVGVTPAQSKRRVTLVRLYSGRMREMDRANIDAKACVDAMVLAGLLKDDNAQWAEIHVKQERGKERGTRVIVEELDA